MDPVTRYVVERLQDFSTWRGIAALAATAGVMIAPEELDAAYKVFVAVLGVAAVFLPRGARRG